MSSRSWRPAVAAVAGLACCAAVAQAQVAPSLRQALDSAWALQAPARAQPARAAEIDARERAARSWLAGPPALALSHRTDRHGGADAGLREQEVALSAPLWSPATRRATAAQVQADRAVLDAQLHAARWELAARLREAASEHALAAAERELAQGKQRDARTLADDVERRVRAGELARVDLLAARGAERLADAAAAQAAAALARAAAQWRALTGLAEVAVPDEPLADAVGREAPAVAAARAALQAAQVRLVLAREDRRDPLEVGVGLTREREAAGAPNERSLTLSLRIPLGGDLRNGARIAAAQAEADQAQAEFDAAQRNAQAARESALAQLHAARLAQAHAAERARGAREAQELVARAWRLGEADLPSRLRAEAERFEAERAQARATLETRRAVSQLNQAHGVLP